LNNILIQNRWARQPDESQRRVCSSKFSPNAQELAMVKSFHNTQTPSPLLDLPTKQRQQTIANTRGLDATL